MPAIYMSDRSSIRQPGVLQLASAFGVCLGAQKQSLSLCPIRVLVLLGSVRPCSLLPVRILSCKTQKKSQSYHMTHHINAFCSALPCMGLWLTALSCLCVLSQALMGSQPLVAFLFLCGFLTGEGPRR